MTPGPRRPAHPPAVRRIARGRARPAPARGRLHGHPRGRRRDPVHGRGDTRATDSEALMRHGRRWLDEMLGHGVTTVEAKSGLRPRSRDRDPSARGGLGTRPGRPDRCRPDVPRRPCGPAGVPRPARRRGGLRPVGHRRAAAGRRGPRAGAVLRRVLRGGRLQRRPVAADPGGGGGVRPGASRLHADELVPSGGAELAAELGCRVGRPPRGAVAGRDRAPWPRPRTRISRSWRRSCRRRPGSS